MTHSVDYFISFRSPFSYLSVDRVAQLEVDWDLTINFRPVYPAALRNPGLFSNPQAGPHIFRDCHRMADYLGIPFQWPKPDPIVQDLETMKIADDQPNIHRLTRLGAEAARRGAGLAFYRNVSTLIFGTGTENWHEGGHLAEAAGRVGLDFADMESSIVSDEAALEALIQDNEAALDATGHWGVPVLAVDGEPFFGQDRIEMRSGG
jgi:2-hydroxychromene-2-carboxylate isomerase